MDGYTLTEIVDINSLVDKLSPAAARALHRRLRDFVPGILKPMGFRGDGPRAPAIFPLHEVAKARIIIKLMELGMGAKSFDQLLRIEDGRNIPNKLRYVSGLDNAIEAALNGEVCSAHFELLNGDGNVRGRFEYAGDPAEPDQVARIIAAQDLARNIRVIGVLTISLNDALSPLFSMLKEIAESETLPDAMMNPPGMGSE